VRLDGVAQAELDEGGGDRPMVVAGPDVVEAGSGEQQDARALRGQQESYAGKWVTVWSGGVL